MTTGEEECVFCLINSLFAVIFFCCCGEIILSFFLARDLGLITFFLEEQISPSPQVPPGHTLFKVWRLGLLRMINAKNRNSSYLFRTVCMLFRIFLLDGVGFSPVNMIFFCLFVCCLYITAKKLLHTPNRTC